MFCCYTMCFYLELYDLYRCPRMDCKCQFVAEEIDLGLDDRLENCDAPHLPATKYKA